MTRLRPAKLTIRLRLTLVYGGLFLLAGVLLLAVTYLLVSQRLPDSGQSASHEDVPVSGPPSNTVASDLVGETQKDALDALLTQGGIALAVVGAVAIGFGWLIAGRMLQPLHRVTDTARRIGKAPAADRELHERIALDGPHDEIKELADTFDVMLERLDDSFDGQRRFIANASHELRTPLTLNRALLESAVHRNARIPQVRELSETLLDINTRHERLIDGLLLLARSERDVRERSFVDFADVVEHVVAQTPRETVAIHSAPRPAPTTGNAVLLERLAQNLVENGVRHNISDGGWVRVTSDTGPDGAAVIVVSNTGPVVPPYEIPNLFEPFHRLATDRLATGKGAGLGLSIVRAVARAHGGQVHAEPRPGGGLIVTVRLPAADAPDQEAGAATDSARDAR
jgi:signal transduction histidine kinase